jgi:ABC-type amino acid transport substrate-binding protein
MVSCRSFLIALALVIGLGAVDGRASQKSPLDRTLIVGTKEAPPFAMKDSAGAWTGISIQLWRLLAADLNLRFEFRELDLQGLLDGVKGGSLDAAVAALTITPEREQTFDFTHPFYTTGLGIAYAPKHRNPWLSVLKRFLSLAFLKVVAGLSFLLLGVGILVWWFERRRNPGQFGGRSGKGIGAGFWWSAVTMTTVGYGDKAPITFGGRIVALIWMFAAIIIISGFTAAITSSLTVTQLESPVKGPKDLPKVRVGTLAHTTSASYLENNRISFRAYKTPVEALKEIVDGKLDAFVYDAPILRYLVHKEFPGRLDVLPQTFVRQDYGIALPEGSPLREPMNRVLLQKIQDEAWQDILQQYFGQ